MLNRSKRKKNTMKPKHQIKTEWLLMLSLTHLISPAAWADTPAFTSGGGWADVQPPNFIGTKGWAFFNNSSIISSNYIAVTQLGVFDQGGDGLVNSHAVGIWAADGTLLASTTIPAGAVATLVDGYRYMPITPVLIPPGAFPIPSHFTALVAAEYSIGDADDLVTPLLGGYVGPVFATSYDGSPTRGFYGLGAGLPFPSQHLPVPEGSTGPAFLEVNFQFNVVQVPEPSVSLLLVPGLLYLFLRRSHSAPNKPA